MPPADTPADLETVRVLFDPHRLTQARHLLGLLKAQVAERVEVTPAAIGQFESGAAKPSRATLQRLALALGVPAEFFAATRATLRISEDDAHFRSLRSTSKADRARARAQVELLAEIVAVIERRVRLPAVNLPALEVGTSPENAARSVRIVWELGDGPLPSVVGLLERKGVIVSRLPAATDELDAFSCWVGARPFVVLVSNKDAADRARFDAAHELAHLVLHHDATPGDVVIEREAHRFAAELLTPEGAIRARLPARVEWGKLAQLKVTWGVSMAMLVRRMRDLDVISDASYRRAMMDLSRRGWRRSEPVELGSPETPEVLPRALQLLEAQRGFGLDAIASELALRADNLAPFAPVFDPIGEDLAV